MSAPSFISAVYSRVYQSVAAFRQLETFAQLPAELTEKLVLRGYDATGRISAYGHFFLGRVLNLTILPACLLLDLGYYGASALKNRLFVVLTKEANLKAAYLSQYQKSRFLAEKCLIGLLFTPYTIGHPDAVSYFFLPLRQEPGKVVPYGRAYVANHVQQFCPKNVADIEQYVQQAIEQGTQLSVSGARMSQGQHILPAQNGHIIDMRGMNQVSIDASRKVAIAEAGATWRDVQVAANNHQLAIQAMQASNIFSIGGSLSANCHGWDHRAGSVGNTVLSLTIVNAEGKQQILKPQDELFKYVIGGYGNFGIIVRAELQLVDNLPLKECSQQVSTADYFTHFQSQVLPNRQIAMHLYRLSLNPSNLLGDGIAVDYRVEGNASVTSVLVDEAPRGQRWERMALHYARRRGYLRKLYWWMESRRLLQNQTVLSRNEIMRAPIHAAMNNSCGDAEWLQEYFVPGEKLADFLKFLGKKLMDNGVALMNATVRYVPEDKHAALGYAHKGDRFAIVLFFNQSLAQSKIQQTEKWVQEVVEYLRQNEGSFYLPYQHFATKEQFTACYDQQWQAVNTAKKKFDPANRFSSGFLAHYLTN